MRAWNAVFRLPSAVWLLGLVSLCNDSASELIYPLVPLYLSSVLMATPKVLGLIEGIAEAVGSLLKLLSGALTDRTHSHKPWVIAGYGIAAVARPLLALTRYWPAVALLRLADRLGKGLRTSPRDALLARVAPAGQRGLAFGLHRAMDNAGAVVGPLLAASLLAAQIPLRQIFLWAALPGALAILLALAVREPAAGGSVPRPPMDWTLRALPHAYTRYLLTLALFTLGNASNMFLLLRARELGLSATQVPLAWALVAAVAMLFSTPLSALSDRVGRVRLIISGWSVYGLFYLLLGFSGARDWALWPLFAGYGLYLAATEGAEKSLVADLAPTERLGSAYGWFNLTTGLMLFPASFVFGTLWQAFSPRAAFGFSAGCALLAAALLRLWVNPRSPGALPPAHAAASAARAPPPA